MVAPPYSAWQDDNYVLLPDVFYRNSFATSAAMSEMSDQLSVVLVFYIILFSLSH